jgi:glyoxylase-like metal-dependent hydrolase (beta-lactamase superfamily II)
MRRIQLTVLLTAAACLAACSAPPTPRQLAQDAAAAMGGVEKLQSIKTITMSGGTGSRTRLGQTVKAGDAETAGQLKNVVETVDLANGRVSLDYELAIGEFSQHRHEILTKKGEQAVGIEIVGTRPIIAASPGGLFSWGTQNNPEFLLRRNAVSIALAAAESASDSGAAQDKELNGKTFKYGTGKTKSGEDVGFYFEPESKLLAAYEVLDTEPLLGDMQSQYLLDDYRSVDGIMLPHRITIRKGGKDFSEVQFTSIALNDGAAEKVFAIPESAAAEADVAAAAAGEYSPMKIVKVDNGVFQAQGYSHHTLIVEFPQWLALVDAPYTDTQTRALGRALEQQFPGKPVRYAAVSHHHYDHIGGIRGAAALGATILVEKGHEAELRPILEARHSNPQDELEKRRSGRQQPLLEVFEGKKVITEGGQSLELYAITGGPHVDPMVLGYSPTARAVFQPDLYTPGGGGGPAAEHLLKSIQSLGIKVDKMVGGHGGVGSYADFVKAVTPKTSSD